MKTSRLIMRLVTELVSRPRFLLTRCCPVQLRPPDGRNSAPPWLLAIHHGAYMNRSEAKLAKWLM